MKFVKFEWKIGFAEILTALTFIVTILEFLEARARQRNGRPELLDPATYKLVVVALIVLLVLAGLLRLRRIESQWQAFRDALPPGHEAWIKERAREISERSLAEHQALEKKLDGFMTTAIKSIKQLHARILKLERQAQTHSGELPTTDHASRDVAESSQHSPIATPFSPTVDGIPPRRRASRGRSPYPDYSVFTGVRQTDGAIATYNRRDVERLGYDDRHILFRQYAGMSAWFEWPWDR